MYKLTSLVIFCKNYNSFPVPAHRRPSEGDYHHLWRQECCPCPGGGGRQASPPGGGQLRRRRRGPEELPLLPADAHRGGGPGNNAADRQAGTVCQEVGSKGAWEGGGGGAQDGGGLPVMPGC